MSTSSSFLVSIPTNHNSFKHASADTEFLKIKEFLDSEFFQNQQQNRLARYRSAPSSFLAALLDSSADNNSSGDDSEAMLSALLNEPRDLNQKNDNSNVQMQCSMKQEVGVEPRPRPGKNGYHVVSESAVNGDGGAVVGSYSVGMEGQVHVRMNNRNCSNLARQSSSPAGFSNGFGVMGEVGNYRVQHHEEANSSANGLSNHMNFSSSGASSSSMFMPSIPENGTESIGTHSPQNRLRNRGSATGREFDTWNGSPFSSLKRNRDVDMNTFSDFDGLENRNLESGKKPPAGLVHHLSLPKTSAEMAGVEKFIQFHQDTVPCQIRAKRGCATHPRSIAERVRRTRISEKMKKLQDLFPNMDKQANTADMLDLAVEYIKDLQKQVQKLTDRKAQCIC